MFWNKQIEKPTRFIKLNDPYHGTSYPAYKDEDTKVTKRLALYEDVERLETKLNLILDHLKLRYVPEKETKEPAKLEEKKGFHNGYHVGCDFSSPVNDWLDSVVYNNAVNYLKPKPKRKYVKSGKYSKKHEKTQVQ